MSMMFCAGCDRLADTDEGTGIFEDVNPWRYWCEGCVCSASKNSSEALLAALKVQKPEIYKEICDE